MTLRLYKNPGGISEISNDSSFSNPIVWEVPEESAVLYQKLYLKMEPGEYCTDGLLYAVDQSGADETSWYSFAADIGGTAGTFASSFEFELDVDEEVPVWIKISVPDGEVGDLREDLRVAASYIRHEEEI